MLRKRLLRVGILVFALLLVALGVGYWYYIHIFVSTDDAYVSGHLTVVSPRVKGRVIKVLVDNNYLVEPGQVLVELDPTDFEVAVNRAQARLGRLVQDLAENYVKVNTGRAKVTQAEANLKLATSDKVRYTALYERRVIPKQTLDRVETRYRVDQALVQQAKHELNQSLAAIGGSAELPIEEQPAIKEAKAQLEQARLNLEYTKVRADVKGFITKRQVNPGTWATDGQPLMMLVPLEYPELWITANYKETELTNVYIGQPAEVRVDTYPGTKFTGRVDSIMAGTGSAFSLLPPENATGNWVKVVQRIPVKIVLEPPFPDNKPLRLGMSTEVIIDTRKHVGPRLLAPGQK